MQTGVVIQAIKTFKRRKPSKYINGLCFMWLIEIMVVMGGLEPPTPAL